MIDGWYKTKRGTLNHPLFKPDGAFSKFEVWHWLIERAGFRDQAVNVHGTIVTVPRGSICTTLRELAAEWSWSVKRVRHFLERLEHEKSIHRQIVGLKRGNSRGTGRTLITLCNYDVYQSLTAIEGTAKGTAGAQQGHIKERSKKEESSVAKATGSAAGGDPAAIVFDQCLAWLIRTTGKSERSCRTLLGRWKRDHGVGAVIEACGRAQREGALDPIAFIEGIWQHKRKAATSDDDRLAAWGIREHDDDVAYRSRDLRRGRHRAAAEIVRDAEDDMPELFEFATKKG